MSDIALPDGIAEAEHLPAPRHEAVTPSRNSDRGYLPLGEGERERRRGPAESRDPLVAHMEERLSRGMG